MRFSDVALTPDFFLPENTVGLRQSQVAGEKLGTVMLDRVVTNITKGEPELTSGLAQFWYEGNMRGNVQAFLEAGDEGSEANPLLNPDGPFASRTTWWAGSRNGDVISDQTLPAYPEGLRGTRFEGSSNEENYGVRLTGEIFVTENGEHLVRDGFDDFAMIAMDQDGNGVLDELETLLDSDVGTGGGIGDVLVLDNEWADIDGSRQQEATHGFADFTDVPEDGEWRKIEIWMSEGAVGDSAIVYMGNFDDPDIFDERDSAGLTQEHRDAFVIRNSQLRSTVAVEKSGDANAELRGDVEYVMQVSEEGSDQFSIDDNEGVYNTTLDVSGATIRIEQIGELSEGTVVTLFDADTVVGTDELTLLLEGPWDLGNLARGQIAFGASTCNSLTGGDVDGSGTVDFADFLILSGNFGKPATSHTEGDLDCSGEVAFADFLILSSNFGKSPPQGGALSVPEPSGWSLLMSCIWIACLWRQGLR